MSFVDFSISTENIVANAFPFFELLYYMYLIQLADPIGIFIFDAICYIAEVHRGIMQMILHNFRILKGAYFWCVMYYC